MHLAGSDWRHLGAVVCALAALSISGGAGAADPPASPPGPAAAASADPAPTDPASPPGAAASDDLDASTEIERTELDAPEVKAFQAAIAAIVERTAKIREFAAQQADPNRRAELALEAQRLLDEMDAEVTRAISVAEAALEKFPGFREAERFLLGTSYRLVEQDRLEEADRVARSLEPRHPESIRLINFLGRAAYELADLDRAELYFRRANDRQALEPYSRQLLLKIDELRPLVEAEAALRQQEAAKDDLPRVLLKTTRGDIVIELFEDQQPNLTANFLNLVNQRFYDGLAFYRVTPAFGASAGCPQGDGSGGPGYELSYDASQAPRLHQRGAVSMVRQGDLVHGSQFFIDYRFSTLSAADRQMPVFGRVVEGIEVAARLHRADPLEPLTKPIEDRIVEAKVLRARPHPYVVKTTLGEVLDQVRSALALATEKKLDQALAILEPLAEKHPQVFDVQLGLGLVLEEAGRGPEALPFLERAIQLRPQHPELSFRLGVLLVGQERFAEAAERFQAAVALNPRDVKGYNNLASMQARLGRNSEAIATLEAALRIDPNYEQAKRNLAKLKALPASGGATDDTPAPGSPSTP